MLPKLRPFGRIKAKYNPQPNAAEKRHEQRLYRLPCYGCGRYGVELHHSLLRFPEKRWRRDHRFQLPVCGHCHRGHYGIHGLGTEQAWLEVIGKAEAEAVAYLLRLEAESVALGILPELREAA